MRNRTPSVVAVLAIAVAACGGGDDADAPGSSSSVAASAGEVERQALTIAAPSLEGNLLGDASELSIEVQTPASYGTEPDRRYPVVYFLAGYDEPGSVTSIGVELAELSAAGEAPEAIVVAVSGRNALGGSFYVDSPVTGGWASAIVDDLVPEIDERYRTMAVPESRGIAGFSMGGYGALALAFDHPDVFGAVYALSPGLLAPGGLAETQMFDDPQVADDFLAGQSELAAMPRDDAASELRRVMARSSDARFTTAYGMAFAPHPSGPPPWVRYPMEVQGGPVDVEVWAAWEAGFGGLAQQVPDRADALGRLRGILIDVGTRDEYRWIPAGCEHLHEQLDGAGVAHRYETFDGGHGPVSVRAGEVMFPFFAEVLVTG